MGLATVSIGDVQVSRLILGGNPFSGFSHGNIELDREMCHYYTAGRIKEEYRRAEALGVNTHIGRADHHIMRVLMEYWDEGGKIQWFAQTCPEVGETQKLVREAMGFGACGCFIHGGRMDWLLANDQLDEAVESVAMIRETGLPAGIAAHNPAVFDWAEDVALDVDFYMCCYYNPTDRSDKPDHVHGAAEKFRSDDRDTMVARIATLSKPAIHYKVLAAGRNDPQEAFEYVARHLRPQDAVCVGVFSKDKPGMLEENVRLLERALEQGA